MTEIDFVRAIAILAVVLIHATSEGIARMPEGSPEQTAYAALNTASHFSVPTFLFLSGLVMGYRYYDRWTWRETAGFWRKRVLRAVAPYLLWSAFYFYWNGWLNGLLPGHPDRIALARMLLQGSAAYHLYFLILIMQYYAIFPLLMGALRRWPSLVNALPVLGIAVQAGYYVWCMQVNPDAYASQIGLTYLSHFLLGCFIGIRYDGFASKARWVAAVLGPLAVLAAAVHVVSMIRPYWGYPAPSPAFHVLVVNLYAILASLSLTAFGRLAVSRSPGLARPLLALGAASFGVYLLHPAIMSGFRHVWPAPHTMDGYHLYTAAGFLASLLGAWGLTALYRLAAAKRNRKAAV